MPEVYAEKTKFMSRQENAGKALENPFKCHTVYLGKTLQVKSASTKKLKTD
jgi:hypothetical protein